MSLLLKGHSKWKAFNYHLAIKRRKFSLTPLQELEVVKGAEHMLTAKTFSPPNFNQIIRFIIFWRFDWLLASLFPRSTGITAKAGWYNKVDIPTLNTITFLLLFSKKWRQVSRRFPWRKYKSLKKKLQTKIQSKLLSCG